MSLVQQTNSFESNLLLAWQLLQPLRLYSQLLQSQHLAHLTPSVQPATIQSLKCTTRILHNIEGYIDTEFLCRTSVAFKSASAVSSRLWQSGTIILDSAKTFSCRGEVQVLDRLVSSEIRTTDNFNNDFSQSLLHEEEKTTSVASCGLTNAVHLRNERSV